MTFLSLCSSVYNNTMMWCKVSRVIAPQVVVPQAADGSISPTPLPSQTFPQFPIWLFRVVLWAGCSLPSVTWWEKFQQCAETEGGRREETHEYTGLCTGLNSDNSSSYCEERDTHTHRDEALDLYLFIYLFIYLCLCGVFIIFPSKMNGVTRSLYTFEDIRNQEHGVSYKLWFPYFFVYWMISLPISASLFSFWWHFNFLNQPAKQKI